MRDYSRATFRVLFPDDPQIFLQPPLRASSHTCMHDSMQVNVILHRENSYLYHFSPTPTGGAEDDMSKCENHERLSAMPTLITAMLKQIWVCDHIDNQVEFDPQRILMTGKEVKLTAGVLFLALAACSCTSRTVSTCRYRQT